MDCTKVIISFVLVMMSYRAKLTWHIKTPPVDLTASQKCRKWIEKTGTSI